MNAVQSMRLPLIALVLLCFFASGCDLVSRDEVGRAKSPDGSVDAILYEKNGGATTSFGYEIELIGKGSRHGEKVAFLYGATRNANAYGVNLKWSGDDELRIEYSSAKDEQLLHPEAKIAGRTIRVVLKSGVDDPSAPSGGMYYNLHQAHRPR
jgi:hypothetical protein